MARRSPASGKVSSYQGRFHRTLGKILNDREQVVPKRFRLGTDRLAEVANLRLQRLWEEVVAEHDAAVRWMCEIGGNLLNSDLVSGQVEPRARRRLDHGPIWRAESLLIAEAIRQGEHQVVVQVGQDQDRPHAYLDRFAYLRRSYSVVTFIPASTELYLAGQQAARKEAGELVQQAQDLAAQAQIALPEATGQTLYQALDAYGTFAVQKNTCPWRSFRRDPNLRHKRLEPVEPGDFPSDFGQQIILRL